MTINPAHECAGFRFILSLMYTSTTRTMIGIGAVVVLLVVNVWVWLHLVVEKREHTVLAFLNIGQGDSIYVRSPDGYDMLIDGGPDHTVLRELPRITGPLDRTIEVMVETHPDQDHIAGLVDVLARYQVRTVMTPGIPHDTDTYRALEDAITREPGVSRVTARRGMRIHLGDALYADVLYPDHDVSRIRATNDGSIVLRLVYGSSTATLTGDAPSTVEDKLVRDYGSHLQSQILKAGHHGSKYSTDALWLRTVAPEIVVVSAGKGNTYGHPSPEVLTRIQEWGARIVSTIESGTIVFESTGERFVQKK